MLSLIVNILAKPQSSQKKNALCRVPNRRSADLLDFEEGIIDLEETLFPSFPEGDIAGWVWIYRNL